MTSKPKPYLSVLTIRLSRDRILRMKTSEKFVSIDDPLSKRDNNRRRKATLTATITSMTLNACLAVAKIIGGIIFGAISVLADGLNNLSDCGSNVISVAGVSAADKPADAEHPYGHARGELIAAMAVSFIILFMAFELLTESIDKIVEGSGSQFSLVTIIIVSLGIAVKLAMFFCNMHVGRKYNSSLLVAAAFDSISDVCASAVVLASIIVERFTSFAPDGYVGCLVAVLIGVSGAKVLKETISALIGESPSREVVDAIKHKLLSYDGIYGIHSLKVHNYVRTYYASVHAEVDASTPLITAHELIDRIERDFDRETDIKLTIHLDPVILNDSEVSVMLEKITEVVKSEDTSFVIHDFRMIKHSDLIRCVFDLYVPYETKRSDEEIEITLRKRLKCELDERNEYSINVTRGN